MILFIRKLIRGCHDGTVLRTVCEVLLPLFPTTPDEKTTSEVMALLELVAKRRKKMGGVGVANFFFLLRAAEVTRRLVRKHLKTRCRWAGTLLQDIVSNTPPMYVSKIREHVCDFLGDVTAESARLKQMRALLPRIDNHDDDSDHKPWSGGKRKRKRAGPVGGERKCCKRLHVWDMACTADERESNRLVQHLVRATA